MAVLMPVVFGVNAPVAREAVEPAGKGGVGSGVPGGAICP